MNHTLYLRTLKHAEHTVFCVEDGQKTYYDPSFNCRVPYSSGQQIKRSILDSFTQNLNILPSPTTFMFEVNKKGELKEGEAYGICHPKAPDQLFGGWMKAAKGGASRTLKRRSPLSISAMRALHPLLANTNQESLSFDRSDRPNNEVMVRDEKGNILSNEEVVSLLEGKDRSLNRKWIPPTARATGLFVQDLAIDLRRLFCVSLNPLEPEVHADVASELREAGWKEVTTVFGPSLCAPAELRASWQIALVDALIDWKITSNQARTFSLMETLAVAISDDANKIAASIRAKLQEENRARPIIEENLAGVKTFVTLPAAAQLLTQSETADALEQAKTYLLQKLQAFDYENQLS